MRAERRQNRLQPVTIVFRRIARQVASAGMHAALVGRYDEHTVSLSKLRKTLGEQTLQLRKQIALDAARGTEEAHAEKATFFSPGASRYRAIKANRYALAAIPNR